MICWSKDLIDTSPLLCPFLHPNRFVRQGDQFHILEMMRRSCTVLNLGTMSVFCWLVFRNHPFGHLSSFSKCKVCQQLAIEIYWIDQLTLAVATHCSCFPCFFSIAGVPSHLYRECNAGCTISYCVLWCHLILYVLYTYMYIYIYTYKKITYVYIHICIPSFLYPILWRHFAKLQALLADAEEYGATLALRTQLRGGQVYQEGWGLCETLTFFLGESPFSMEQINYEREKWPFSIAMWNLPDGTIVWNLWLWMVVNYGQWWWKFRSRNSSGCWGSPQSLDETNFRVRNVRVNLMKPIGWQIHRHRRLCWQVWWWSLNLLIPLMYSR